MPTLDDLMTELQELGGVVPGPVRPSRASYDGRALFEGDDGMAAREAITGRLEVLAKRMEGVLDFVGDDNMKAARIALDKILKDARDVLGDMGSSKKKAEKGDEEEDDEDDGDDEQQKPKKKSPKPEKPGGAPDRRIGREQQSPQAKPQQSAPKKGTVKEGRIYADGVIIENMNDPFGRGEEFKRAMQDWSGIKG